MSIYWTASCFSSFEEVFKELCLKRESPSISFTSLSKQCPEQTIYLRWTAGKTKPFEIAKEWKQNDSWLRNQLRLRCKSGIQSPHPDVSLPNSTIFPFLRMEKIQKRANILRLLTAWCVIFFFSYGCSTPFSHLRAQCTHFCKSRPFFISKQVHCFFFFYTF